MIEESDVLAWEKATMLAMVVHAAAAHADRAQSRHRPDRFRGQCQAAESAWTALAAIAPGYSFESIAPGDLQRNGSAPEPVSRDLCASIVRDGNCAAPRSGAHGLRSKTSSKPAGSPPSRSASNLFRSGEVRVTGSARSSGFRARIYGVVRWPTANGVAVRACVSRRFQLGSSSDCAITSIRITSIGMAKIALGALELKLSDGVTLAVPASLEVHDDLYLLEQETWFEKETIFLRHWLQPGMTVIDIGANLGTYSLPMARLVGPTGQVFAYEPGSETRALLERKSRIERGGQTLQILACRAIRRRARGTTGVFGDSSEFNALGDSGAGENGPHSPALDTEEKVRGWQSPDFGQDRCGGRGGAHSRGGDGISSRGIRRWSMFRDQGGRHDE